MQIDKTQNIQIQGFRDSIIQKDIGPKSAARNKSDISIDINYQQYTDQLSAAASADETQKIEEARKLLASGALDSPEAALKAAENLLKYGI